MKFLRHGPAGHERPGLLAPDGSIRDLTGTVADIDGRSIASGALLRAAQSWETLPAVPRTPRLGPPVAGVGKFLGIGLNYADHAAESGMAVPERPILFFKSPTSIAGPDDELRMPENSVALDWEVELGIVIGREAACIGVEEAREHIFGYLVVNDVSEREWQLQHSGAQWSKGKSQDGFGPLGPWLVTRDEVPDVGNLDMRLTVNGELMQQGNTRTMIFDVDRIVADISQYMRLMPGDVIATGTPPGVGMGLKPPRYLQRGDVVQLQIDRLGVQTQRVV